MSIAQINSYRITLLEYKAKLNPIRIDFILFSKKKKKMVSCRDPYSQNPQYWFWLLLLQLVSEACNRTTIKTCHIYLQANKKSPQMKESLGKKKEPWSCALTMIHYQLTQRSYSGNTHIELYITRMHWFIVVITSTSLKDSALLQLEGYILFTAIN